MPAKKAKHAMKNIIALYPNYGPHPRPQTRRRKPLSASERRLLRNMQKLASCVAEFALTGGSPWLIPHRLFDDLGVAVAVACYGTAAEDAHRLFGVPASFLIAKRIVESGFPAGDAELGSGERYPFQRWFFNEARRLATHPIFSLALKHSDNPIRYARELQHMGMGNGPWLLDVASYIANYGLCDCDRRHRQSRLPSEMSADEAARILALSRESVYSLISSGELVGCGGSVLLHSVLHYEQRRLYREIQEQMQGGEDAVEKPGANVLMFKLR